MKRLLVIVLTLCIVLSFSACGSKDKNDDVANANSGNNATTQTDTSSETADNKQDESKVDLMYTFEDPSKPVVFDYPNLKCIEEGTSRVFKNSKYVMVYCRDTGNCELKDIPNTLSEKFYNSTDTHLIAPFESFSIEKTDSISVSNQNVLQINGYVVVKRGDGSLVNLPMQGYTFIKEDTICELIAVLNEETNDTNQSEMEETVEAMIKTLREQR